MIPSSVRIDGTMLARMIASAEIVLEKNLEGVNSLNVFPVPDGDTGTNMLLTLRAVIEETNKSPLTSLAEISKLVARGALFLLVILPSATCDRRLSWASIMPQPVFRNPGSIPRSLMFPL